MTADQPATAPNAGQDRITTTAACQDATHRTCHHSFATLEEAERFIATYEAERCLCGGSPSWVDPRYQMHVTSCERLRNGT